MCRIVPLALMFALLCPCAAVLTSPPAAQAQAHAVPRKTGKLTDALRARARDAQKGERTRVIVSLARGADAETSRRSLESAGAHVQQQLDQLGVMVADVPTDQLEALATRNEVAWLSEDAEVRSLATTPDNTSHVEVTTGASLILPSGNNNEAQGGAGNGVGTASA